MKFSVDDKKTFDVRDKIVLSIKNSQKKTLRSTLTDDIYLSLFEIVARSKP